VVLAFENGKTNGLARAVVDTNVLVAAMMLPKTEQGKIEQHLPALAVIKAIEAGRLTLVYCHGICSEYQQVLHPGRLSLRQHEIDMRLNNLLELGERVSPQAAVDSIANQFHDHSDLIYYETALAGNVDWIITSNLAHFSASTIPVISPQQYDEEVGQTEKGTGFWTNLITTCKSLFKPKS
jgi:predicted nucleic acid-binding protein